MAVAGVAAMTLTGPVGMIVVAVALSAGLYGASNAVS
jgi:hypothetical protein